jgi:hypothetical protein
MKTLKLDFINARSYIIGLVFALTTYKWPPIDIIEYVNVAHNIGSETLFKITGTCGQDPMPMVPLIAHPSFFLTSIFFHVHNILQLSMYHCMTYIQKKTIKQQFLSILGFWHMHKVLKVFFFETFWAIVYFINTCCN